MAGQFEWYELKLQAGGVLESHAHEPGTREHLTVTNGSVEVSTAAAGAAQAQRVKAGETVRYAVDVPHAIKNIGKAAATAWLVVVHPA